MAIGDLYQLVVVFANDNTGKNLSTTIGLEQTAVVAPDMTTLGDDVKEWWDTGYGAGTPAFKTYCAAAIKLQEVTLRRVKPLEPLIQSYTTGLPIAGTAAGDPYSAQAGPLVSLRTANIGKSYRGRMYLPPVAEGFVGVNASLTAATAEDIAESIDSLRASLLVDSARMIVWSRKLNAGTVVTGVLADRLLRTQRRRQDRTPVYVAP